MRALASLHPYFFRYKFHFFWGIFFVTVSNLFGIFPAQLTRKALDVVADELKAYQRLDGLEMQPEVYRQVMWSIFMFGALVLLMALLKGVFMFLMRQTIIVMSRHIEFDLKNAVYTHYQQLGMDFYNRNSTGDLMNRISEDVGRVRMYVGPALMYSINMVVMFILVIAAMYNVNATLATWVLLPLPLMAGVVYYVHDRISRKSERVQEQLSVLSSFVQETFSGIRLIKSFAREKDYDRFYRKHTDDFRDISMDLVRTNAFFIPAMSVLVGFSTLITVYLGSLEVMAGNITVGNIAEFVIYVNMLTWPVAALGWVVSLVQRAEASQQRINAFLNEQPSIVGGPLECAALNGEVVFKDVTITYGDDRAAALKAVDFTIPAGSSLGIIGRTGAGKSSVVNALLRLTDPQSGQVMVNGVPLQQFSLSSYRNKIGCVPQDVFLFSDTIAENIAFGTNRQVTRQEIEEAARIACVYDAVMEFNDGFDTLLGERGITLSGGQKQRVSIARALIRQPDMLIFDDCLSAVDTITEEKILRNLRQFMKGKTSIMVSHRVATVKDCNKIIVLEAGAIVQEGTHASLIRTDGFYRQLYERQLLDESAAAYV